MWLTLQKATYFYKEHMRKKLARLKGKKSTILSFKSKLKIRELQSFTNRLRCFLIKSTNSCKIIWPN